MAENRIVKKIILAAVLAMAVALLTGCGSGEVKCKNADGTVSRIEYEKVSALARAPHFEKSADGMGVDMKFNGSLWYNARFACAEEVDDNIQDLIPVAESSNIKAYQELKEAQYNNGWDLAGETNTIMVMKLEGSDDAYIIFESSSDLARGMNGYGTDIDYLIRYFVDKTETIPDVNGLKLLPGIEDMFSQYDEEHSDSADDAEVPDNDAEGGDNTENTGAVVPEDGTEGGIDRDLNASGLKNSEWLKKAHNLCGIYYWISDHDENENRVYDINLFGDILCIEVESGYDYWGAEIEPISNGIQIAGDAENAGEESVLVGTMRAFSGFSLGGDYWDDGMPCSITDNGDFLTLVVGDEIVEITRDYGSLVANHTLDYAASVYTPQDLVGMWVMHSSDCEKCYVEFDDMGNFCLARKLDSEPVQVFFGKIEFDEDTQYSVVCERFAYGRMPIDSVLKYKIEDGKLILDGCLLSGLGVIDETECSYVFEAVQ